LDPEQRAEKPPHRGKIFFLTAIFSCLLLLGGALFLVAYQYISTPIADPGREKIVAIPKGLSFNQIARRLQKEDIIKNAWKFRLLARIQDKAAKVQAGEFRIHTHWTPARILDTLTQGQAVLYKLSIPEGLTWWETARIVQKSGLASYSSFASAAQNSTLLRRYNIPGSTAEGYLFPETYHVPRPEDKDALPIVSSMLEEFREQTKQQLWPQGPPKTQKVHRIVTIASLVEKETSVAEERATVAGVYMNRLEKGMRLQCDPTTIYGLGRQFDGNLTKKHLKDSDNPYNTYQHAGLPPGPICSPGLASLQATLNPEEHDYLYFVAKGDGSHHFSKTLAEHNRAVRKYQLRR
jgi:UPF0755 protein